MFDYVDEFADYCGLTREDVEACIENELGVYGTHDQNDVCEIAYDRFFRRPWREALDLAAVDWGY